VLFIVTTSQQQASLVGGPDKVCCSGSDLSWCQSGIVGGNVFDCDQVSLSHCHGPSSRGDDTKIWVEALAFEDTISVDVILGVSNQLLSRGWEVDFESPVGKNRLLHCDLDLNSVLRGIFITIGVQLGDYSGGRRNSSDSCIARCESSAVVVVVWNTNSHSLGGRVSTAVSNGEGKRVRGTANGINANLAVGRVKMASLSVSSVV